LLIAVSSFGESFRLASLTTQAEACFNAPFFIDMRILMPNWPAKPADPEPNQLD